MRTTTIELKGEKYLLCLSLKGIDNLSTRYGGLDNVGRALQSPDIADAIIFLAEMMNCGAMYAKLNGIANPKPLSEEEIGYGVDLAELMRIKEVVQGAAAVSMKREVETLPNQNATATESK